jgi:hypothetical protein
VGQEPRAYNPAHQDVAARPIRSEEPPARHGQQNQESLLVEIAWLIIDGAKVFRRLRRILARL